MRTVHILRRSNDRSGDAELLATSIMSVRIRGRSYLDGGCDAITASSGVILTGPSTLIRWGCTDAVSGYDTTINRAKDITLTANKGLFRADMAMRGLGKHFPATWWDFGFVPWDDFRNTGLLLRPTKHARGQEFHVLTGNRQMEQAVALRERLGPVYVQELIRVAREYRITFCHGRVVQVVERDTETTGRPVPQNQNNVNNIRWGQWPINVIKSVWPVIQACPLTFGAMDVLVEGSNMTRVCVGEINSAPEIYPYSAQCLAKAILFYLNSDVTVWEPTQTEGRETYQSYIHPALIND